MISLPKAFLSFEYANDLSYAPEAIPNACAAIPILPPARVFIANAKPNPSAPILFSLGTFTSLNKMVCVSLPLIPSLFSFAPTITPCQLFSTTNALIPRLPLLTSVCAITRYVLALLPFVIQFLVPFSR